MNELIEHVCSIYYGTNHLLAKIVGFWEQTDLNFNCYLPENLQLELKEQLPEDCFRDLEAISASFHASSEQEITTADYNLDVNAENVLVPVTLLINKFTKDQVSRWEEGVAEQLASANNCLICLYDLAELIENSQQEDEIFDHLLTYHDKLVSNQQFYNLKNEQLNKEKAFF